MTKSELKSIIRECLHEELSSLEEDGYLDKVKDFFKGKQKKEPKFYYCVTCGTCLSKDLGDEVHFRDGDRKPQCKDCYDIYW